jgi:hypothetical protein
MLVAEQEQGWAEPPGTGDRLRGDAGAGLVGLLAGTLIFLVFLLFASHLLLNLYARSIAAGAAFDGAQYVARNEGRTDRPMLDAARRVVEAQVGPANLLAAGPGPKSDADHIEYVVLIKAPRVMAQSWIPGWSSEIERTARVRIEKKQQ